jgi:hypothetical protein
MQGYSYLTTMYPESGSEPDPIPSPGYRARGLVQEDEDARRRFPGETRERVLDGKRFTFNIPKKVNSLAGALLLQHKDWRRVVVMLGSNSDFWVAFNVIP